MMHQRQPAGRISSSGGSPAVGSVEEAFPCSLVAPHPDRDPALPSLQRKDHILSRTVLEVQLECSVANTLQIRMGFR